MALTINAARTFDARVTVHFHDNGKPAKGTFGASYKVVPFDKIKDSDGDESLLDLVLVSVDESELKLTDEQGQTLTGDALLNAVKTDPSIATALVSTYNEQVTKKNLKRT